MELNFNKKFDISKYSNQFSLVIKILVTYSTITICTKDKVGSILNTVARCFYVDRDHLSVNVK